MIVVNFESKFGLFESLTNIVMYFAMITSKVVAIYSIIIAIHYNIINTMIP